MRRWLPAAAIGGTIALMALAIVFAMEPGEQTPGERTDAIARELRCPDCQGLSVADSPTRSAQEMRRQIAALVEAGASTDEVRAHFADRYGEWILLAPTSPLAWIIPFAVLLAGAAVLAAWLLRRERPSAPSRPVSVDDRRQLHEEAEALDA